MSKQHKTIFGIKAIINALEQNQNIEEIFLNRNLPQAGEALQLQRFAYERSVPVTLVTPLRLQQQFGFIPKNDAVAVLSKIRFTSAKNLIERLNTNNDKYLPMLIALDGVRIPGNVGTILRSIDAAGALGLISDNKTVISNNRLMRNASAGAIFTVPVARSFELAKELIYAKNLGIPIIATSSHDLTKTRNLYDLDLTHPHILVLGAEETGVSEQILNLADIHLKIPQVGTVESLNVGVAASIIIFEALRQKSRTNPC